MYMRNPILSLDWKHWLGCLVGAALFLAQDVAHANAHNLEYRVKAAFLFNFTKFVDWPPNAFTSASAPLEICVLGIDPFGSLLDEAVLGKSINEHPLRIRRVGVSSDIESCRVLYVSDSERANFREMSIRLSKHPILTVADFDGFTNEGGMIRFMILDGKVRFEVNRSNAEQARLTLSSKLLSVAHTVISSAGR